MAIDPGPEGVIFVSTKAGAKLIDLQSNMLAKASDYGIPDTLYSGFSQIVAGGDGVFWGLRQNTVFTIKKLGARKYSCQPWFDIPGHSTPNKIVADPADPDAVWILWPDWEVWRARPHDIKKYSIPKPSTGLAEEGLIQLCFSAKGLIGWDLLQNIYQFDPRKNTFKKAKKGLKLSDYFPDLSAVDFAMRQKGVLRCYLSLDISQTVLGTTLGLFIVRKRNTHFKTLDALREVEIRGINIDSSGNWIVGAYPGVYTGKLGQPKFNFQPTKMPIWAFLPLQKNTWLLGLEANAGLQLWNPGTQKFFDTEMVQRMPNPKDFEGVLSLIKDCYGIKWAGSFHNLSYCTSDNPIIFQPYRAPVTGQALKFHHYRAILSAKDSSLWLGVDEGLFRMRYKPNFRQYQLEKPTSYIGKVLVSDLYEDRFGNIWVATKGLGLAKYDNASGEIKWFSLEAGICDTMLCRIESSNHDSVLWISTHNGLSRFEVSTQIFHNFYEESGFPGNEFNSAASTRHKDGTLFFGGINGLIYFHPDSIPWENYLYNTTVPFIHIYDKKADTQITLNGSSTKIHLDPYLDLIEFALGSNEMIQPNKIRYRFRLLGLSDNWAYITGDNKVKYVRLPPGNYDFQVQAVPLEGHFGNIFSLNVLVATPYYESWWFRALLLGAGVLLVFAAYQYRLRQILKEQLIRQQVADDLHDDIGNKLNIIGILTQKVAGFFKKSDMPLPPDNAIKNLLELSRDAQLSLTTMIWSVDPKKDKMANLIDRMQDFADDYVRPLLPQFYFKASISFPDRDIDLRVRHHLMLIYQELLVNMIKHTRPSRIDVEVRLFDGHKLSLSISNLHQKVQTQAYNTTSGNRGQSTLNRRLKEINATIEYLQEESTFQKIRVEVPDVFKKQ